MRRAAALFAFLLAPGCDGEQERAEQAQEHLDSMVENRDARPAVPLEYEDVRIGTPTVDTVPPSQTTGRP